MVNTVVIDASVALSMLFEDEASDIATSLETLMLDGGHLIAPAIILWEITNVIRSGLQSGRFTHKHASHLLQKFAALPLQIQEVPVLGELADLALFSFQNNVTSYDAAYLQLAHGRKLPLATLDRGLIRAAKLIDVSLFS